MAACLSAAPIGTGLDNIGVPITNVGEFDTSFIPHVDDDGANYSRIIYRNNGILFFVDIRPTAIHTLQKVSDNLYTVNCLSAINAIDIRNKQLATGVNDYNGRFVFRGTPVLVANHAIVGIVQGKFANSIDFGDKFTTFPTPVGSVNPFGVGYIPGIQTPSFVDRVTDFAVNIYSSDVYYMSGASYQSFLINETFVSILYVPDTRDPFAMGGNFLEGHTFQTEIETILTGVGVIGSADINYDYLCYEIGNDIVGLFQAFQLFGQTYIFDGQNIWLTSFQGSLFNGKGNVPLAGAAGMQLIAAAPTEVFFLSPSDNSLYSYNGGRSLTKQIRMNQQDIISGGVFSTRDNTLLLNGSNSFIWIRDSVVSANAKKTNQAGTLGLYDTVNGIIIANLTMSWLYSFFALSGSTVVPFVWQGGYFGITENKLGVFSAFWATLFNVDKTAINVMFTMDGFDMDGEWHEDIPFTIKPGDWTPKGFYRAKIVPQHTLGLALSPGMKTTSHIVLNEMVAEFTPSSSATPAASRSK